MGLAGNFDLDGGRKLVSAAAMGGRYAVVLGTGPDPDKPMDDAGWNAPRSEYSVIAEAVGADIFSFRLAARRRGFLFSRLFGKRPNIGSGLDFAVRSSGYDGCYITGEDIGLPAAAGLKAMRWRGRLVMVVHNVTAKKARAFRLLGHKIFHALIVVGDRQKERLVAECGIPESKIVVVRNWVDDQFFEPGSDRSKLPGKIVMACGAENRDYSTLIAAAPLVQARFRVFAHGFFVKNDVHDAAIPGNVEKMPKISFNALRREYQNCSAVAVPLNDVEYAAGVTGLVEAMACGRLIVVSRTRGLAGYLDAIEPDMIVPAGDVAAMSVALGSKPNQRVEAAAVF